MTNCTGQEYKVCSGAIKIANIADLKKKKKIEKKALEQFGSKTEIKESLNKLEEEFKMNWGYGHSVRPMKKETTSDIYIQTGEALTDEDAESTIERISKLFNKEE